MKELIDEGWVGTPYIYNAYEQNSQWIDPQTPLRQVPSDVDADRIRVSSLEGYGAPVIDLGHWFMDADLTSVVGVLRNFVPERMIRETGTMMRANIDDGDIFIGEFASGAICSVQSSFVTVGNYPGIEVRVYGSEGALIARLVEEYGVWRRSGREARRRRVRRPRGPRAPVPDRAATSTSPGRRSTTRT